MTPEDFHTYLSTHIGFIENAHIHELDNTVEVLSDFCTIAVAGAGGRYNAKSPNLINLFKDLKLNTGAEIGVYEGKCSENMCKILKGTIYSIDPWKHYPIEIYPERDTNLEQHLMDERYEKAAKLLSAYPNSKILRKESTEALSDFANESLDFVYIDSNHTVPFIWQDLHGWWPKIKKGGIMSGHDYSYIYRVIQSFMREKGIKHLYLDDLGKEDWFFLKY